MEETDSEVALSGEDEENVDLDEHEDEEEMKEREEEEEEVEPPQREEVVPQEKEGVDDKPAAETAVADTKRHILDDGNVEDDD